MFFLLIRLQTLPGRYRRKRERLVEFTAVAPIPTMWGPFKAYCFKSLLDGVEHIAMVKVRKTPIRNSSFVSLKLSHTQISIKTQGEIGDGKDILVRVHAECLTDDIVGNSSGGKQLGIAMRQIEETGRGVFVYLRGPEAKGIDLSHKPRTYNNTSDQTEAVSLRVASREYGIGAQVIEKNRIFFYKLCLLLIAKINQRYGNVGIVDSERSGSENNEGDDE